ncbi:BnaA04g24660D [Brassica napus]|uniref:BnaA04g24660D protein n=1 Tax=Brassica napus TaxID=3708 RepID=A0A078IFP1_BRANA|nr:BnaA04g24660D [Brassica napus]
MQRKSNGCVWYCIKIGLPRSSRTCFLFLLLLSSQSHKYCIVRYLVSRGVIMMMGFGAGTYGSGDKVAKYEERMKAIDNDAWETLAMQQELLYLDMYES